MKYLKRLTALCVAIVLAVGLAPVVRATGTNQYGMTWSSVNETVYATTNVNVRAGAGTNFAMKGYLSKGESVHRTAIGSDGWSKVEYKGKEAYVATRYLTKVQSGSVENVDYNDLTKQVAIANGLKQQDYTQASWAVMMKALEAGENALRSKKQDQVDSAYKALQSAIADLELMDYTQLWAVLRKVETLNEPDEAYDLWAELVLAVENGRDLLASGDQAAVDAGVAEIDALLSEVKSYLDSLDDPQIVIKEVEVEVPPSDDFCNIAGHHTWVVLFIISAALNVALAAAVIAILRKKEKQADDTPLIQYDIEDDLFDEE